MTKICLSLILVILASCNNQKELKPRNSNTPPPKQESILSVYNVTMVDTPASRINRSYLGELASPVGSSFGYLFENQSQESINGVFQEFLPTLPPSFVASAGVKENLILTSFSGEPLCRELTVLGPNEQCEIIVDLDFVKLPKNQRGLHPIFQVDFNSNATAQTYQASISFEGLIGLESDKDIYGIGFENSYNFTDPQFLDQDGEPRGKNIIKISISSGNWETIGPCHTRLDGSEGDARGINPYGGRNTSDTFRVINNKILFGGRGCSWNGSNLDFERYGLWEFDTDQPSGPLNPRRISRDSTSVGAVTGNMGSSPSHWMKVVNNKLYYNSVTLTGGVLDGGGYDRMALFEYDPSQSLSLGINPKEIDMNYTSYGGASYPKAVATHNGKIYTLAEYYTDSNIFHGIIEYDPSLPINLNDTDSLEVNDNPKFLWGFNQSEYYSYEFELLEDNSFLVDEDFFVIGARLPDDILNPSHTRSTNGKELTFIRRSDYQVTTFDICTGSCSSDPSSIETSGDTYVVDVRTLRADLSNDRTIAGFTKSGPVGNRNIALTYILDSDPTGEDIPFDSYNSKLVKHDGNIYFGLSEGVGRNLYVHDGATGMAQQLVYGASFSGGNQSFYSIKSMDNNRLSWLGQTQTGTSYTAIYDPSLALMGPSPLTSFANPIAKFYGWIYDIAEDVDNYYISLAVTCGGNTGFYVDLVSKHMDFATNQTVDRFQSVCDEPRPTLIEKFLIIK